MWNNVRGNTSSSNLWHPRIEPFDLFCTTHRGGKISQYYYAVYKIMRSLRKHKCKHVRATRERRNLQPLFKKRLRVDYVTLLECGNCFTGPHSFLFSYQTKVYAMHHGEMETICYFITTYSVLCTSCLYLRSSSIDHFPSCESGSINDTYLRFYSQFLGLKGSNHAAGFVFYIFFPMRP